MARVAVERVTVGGEGCAGGRRGEEAGLRTSEGGDGHEDEVWAVVFVVPQHFIAQVGRDLLMHAGKGRGG